MAARLAVLALGANGAIGGEQISAALRVVGRHRVLGLVTPRNSPVSAGQMRRAARRHPDQVLLIDWVAFSAGHGAWFAGDGLHVNGAGASALATNAAHGQLADLRLAQDRRRTVGLGLRTPRRQGGRRHDRRALTRAARTDQRAHARAAAA